MTVTPLPMKRVLFVDDEPRLLAGLKLSLRGKRTVWDMVFVEGGRAALDEVTAHPLDVIVSDMRMPGMSGAELLSRVAAIRPEATRIILSGQMDEAGAVRAASVAHRFLTKPCDSKMLEATIARAIETHEWLRSDRLRSAIGTLEMLPSSPRIFAELNAALADPNASTGDIAGIIEADPAVAAKVLQLVNSSFFGLSRKMVNITQAVGYLGVSSIKSLALANSLFDALGNGDEARSSHAQMRSLLRARVARRLISEPIQAETAATAALLLDVGTLVLESRLPAECAANIAEARERGLAPHEVERERFGVTHAEIGAYLLDLWGLPHEIVEALATHHADWTGDEALDASTAARISDALVSELDASTRTQGAGPPPALLERLQIADAVRALREEIALSGTESN